MKHDIGQVLKETREKFPNGKPLLAREALIVLEATRQASSRTRKHVVALPLDVLGDTPKRQRDQLVRRLDRLDSRLDVYARDLARVKPEAPFPKSVRPLLHNVIWPIGTPRTQKHLSPDFIVPFSIDNQAGELEQFGPFQLDAFLDYVEESAVELKENVEEAAEVVVDKVLDAAAPRIPGAGGASKWVWAVGLGSAATLGGLLFYKVYRG